jgi:hypothetical protein
MTASGHLSPSLRATAHGRCTPRTDVIAPNSAGLGGLSPTRVRPAGRNRLIAQFQTQVASMWASGHLPRITMHIAPLTPPLSIDRFGLSCYGAIRRLRPAFARPNHDAPALFNQMDQELKDLELKRNQIGSAASNKNELGSTTPRHEAWSVCVRCAAEPDDAASSCVLH